MQITAICADVLHTLSKETPIRQCDFMFLYSCQYVRFYDASQLSSAFFFFFSSRRRHTISLCDWSSDVCSSDLAAISVQRVVARRHGLDAEEAGTGRAAADFLLGGFAHAFDLQVQAQRNAGQRRSEERRVGKECRSRWSPYH